jgi:hypothetical protein
MPRPLSLPMLMALILGCASCASDPQASPSSKQPDPAQAPSAAAVIFLDDIGLSYTLPTGWEEQRMFRPSGVRAMYRLTPTTATVAISAKNTAGTAATDLDGQVQHIKTAYQQQFGGLKILEESDAALGPDTGRRLTVEGTKLGITFRTTQLIASHPGRSVAIVLVGRPAEHDAALEATLQLARELRWK